MLKTGSTPQSCDSEIRRPHLNAILESSSSIELSKLALGLFKGDILIEKEQGDVTPRENITSSETTDNIIISIYDMPLENQATTPEQTALESLLQKMYELNKKRADGNFSTDFNSAEILSWFYSRKSTSFEPTDGHSLDLSNKNLYLLTPEQWTVVFVGLKIGHITKLDLSSNELKSVWFADRWEAFFLGVSTSKLTGLSLSRNFLSGETGWWNRFFEALAVSPIKELNLGSNDFPTKMDGSYSSERSDFFEGLQKLNLDVLKLDSNNLSELEVEDWQAFFIAAKAANICRLNLGWNNISELNAEQRTAFLEGLQTLNLTELNLAGNDLYKLTTEEWTRFFSGFQAAERNVLYLERNKLDNLGFEEWQFFLRDIKKSSIYRLYISKDELDEIRTNELKTIIEHKVKVYLSLCTERPLLNLCRYYFWSHPNASLEKSKEDYFYKADDVEPVSLTEAQHDCLKVENLSFMGLHVK
jgi:hypothetical protein